MARKRSKVDEAVISTAWAPQPGPQTEAITADWCEELFYGGAAGGGKSDFLLGDFLQDVATYGRHWHGVLFRRTYNELEELIRRSREIYPASSAVWHEQAKTWTWPNGANLKMRYIERDADATRYQGHQYTWIGWDELTQWPSDYGYRYLRARLRSAHGVPTKRIRAAANPGGVGHHWVKAYFVAPAIGGYQPVLDAVTKHRRMFIPAKLWDNRVLLNSDPTYGDRLKGLASETQVRAWLEGDWNVIEGAFFDCWRQEKHVVEPFVPPRDWTRLRSMDWGSAKPFSVGWWAVVGDDFVTPCGHKLQRGALVRYREWYGASGPNVGLKMTAEDVAGGIVFREKHPNEPSLRDAVLDPACFREDGGPSIAERMNRVLIGQRLRPFREADNSRVPQYGRMGGWDQLRARLMGTDDGPMIFCMSNQSASIRTIPALKHDESKPEDVDTESEDHCFAAGTLVQTSKGPRSFQDLLGQTGLVRSSDGKWHRFRSVRRTRRSQSTVRLIFDRGDPIQCTPDHKFLTVEGWRSARSLAGAQILSLSPIPFKSSVGNGTISAEAVTIAARVFFFIELCGSRLMDLCQRAGTFITKTVIGTTTQLQISTVYPLSIINRESTGWNTASAARSIFQWPDWPRQSGTGAWTDTSGTRNSTIFTARQRSTPRARLNAAIVGTLASLGCTMESFVLSPAKPRSAVVVEWIMKFEAVRSALGTLQSIAMERRNAVQESAVQSPALAPGPVCLRVEEAEVMDVYCFTVPAMGNFELESGMIASQCGDEWRYACMSRPLAIRPLKEATKISIGYSTKPTQRPGDWVSY